MAGGKGGERVRRRMQLSHPSPIVSEHDPPMLALQQGFHQTDHLLCQPDIRAPVHVCISTVSNQEWPRLLECLHQLSGSASDWTLAASKRYTCSCSVCRLTVPNREWPGLLEWLHQLSGSSSEHSRQAALHIFAALTEVIGRPHHVPFSFSSFPSLCVDVIHSPNLIALTEVIPAASCLNLQEGNTLQSSLTS